MHMIELAQGEECIAGYGGMQVKIVLLKAGNGEAKILVKPCDEFTIVREARKPRQAKGEQRRQV